MITSNSVVKTLLIIRPLKSKPDGTMNDASTQSAKLHNSQSIARGDYFFRGNCISFGRATRKKQQQVLVVARQIEKLQKIYPLSACLKSGRTADLTFGTLRSFKRINVGVVTLEFGVLSKRDAICKRWTMFKAQIRDTQPQTNVCRSCNNVNEAMSHQKQQNSWKQLNLEYPATRPEKFFSFLLLHPQIWQFSLFWNNLSNIFRTKLPLWKSTNQLALKAIKQGTNSLLANPNEYLPTCGTSKHEKLPVPKS